MWFFFFINIQVLLSYKKDNVTPVTFYKVLYIFYLSFLQKRIPSMQLNALKILGEERHSFIYVDKSPQSERNSFSIDLVFLAILNHV